MGVDWRLESAPRGPPLAGSVGKPAAGPNFQLSPVDFRWADLAALNGPNWISQLEPARPEPGAVALARWLAAGSLWPQRDDHLDSARLREGRRLRT